jgi:hypothetical protein
MKHAEKVFRIDVELHYPPILDFNQQAPAWLKPFVKQADAFRIVHEPTSITPYPQDLYQLYFINPVRSLRVYWDKLSISFSNEESDLFNKNGTLFLFAKLYTDLLEQKALDSITRITITRHLFFEIDKPEILKRLQHKLVPSTFPADSDKNLKPELIFREQLNQKTTVVSQIRVLQDDFRLKVFYSFAKEDNPAIADSNGLALSTQAAHVRPDHAAKGADLIDMLENDYRQVARAQERILEALPYQ